MKKANPAPYKALHGSAGATPPDPWPFLLPLTLSLTTPLSFSIFRYWMDARLYVLALCLSFFLGALPSDVKGWFLLRILGNLIWLFTKYCPLPSVTFSYMPWFHIYIFPPSEYKLTRRPGPGLCLFYSILESAWHIIGSQEMCWTHEWMEWLCLNRGIINVYILHYAVKKNK